MHKNSKLKPGENMLCTEIVSYIQNIFCTQHVLPMFFKKKSFWQRFNCTAPYHVATLSSGNENNNSDCMLFLFSTSFILQKYSWPDKMYISKTVSLSDLEFEIFTLVSGLGFWLFGFLWLFYGHHSNEFLGVFLLLVGFSLSVISIISGVSQHRKKSKGRNSEISPTTYSSTKTQERNQLPWNICIRL